MKNYNLLIPIFIFLLTSCSSDNDPSKEDGIPTDSLLLKVLLNGNANDSSGNNHDGEISGQVTPDKDRNDIVENAMAFNENDGYLDFGNIESLKLDYFSSITISVWIKIREIEDNENTILSNFGGGPPPSAPGRFNLNINSNKKIEWNVFSNILESNTQISSNQWTHILVDYKDQNMRLFVNGELDSTLNIGSDMYGLFSGAPFRIGKKSLTPNNSTGLNGSIDDIYIYGRLLENEEIKMLYQEN